MSICYGVSLEWDKMKAKWIFIVNNTNLLFSGNFFSIGKSSWRRRFLYSAATSTATEWIVCGKRGKLWIAIRSEHIDKIISHAKSTETGKRIEYRSNLSLVSIARSSSIEISCTETSAIIAQGKFKRQICLIFFQI